MKTSGLLFEAHVHLAKLHPELPAILTAYNEVGLSKAVVVGTSTDDWEEVLGLAGKDERLVPAVGLHPWRVNNAPADWQEQMLGYLNRGVRVIGEFGLDQWVEGHDIERQQEAFRWQLAIAAERNLPTSIHCLKAHEPLLQTLREVDLPKRGFKLHAYNGPVKTMKALLELGAYFSFNAGQLKPNARRVRELIRIVPEDRILIETDAPYFLPPDEFREFELSEAKLSHPANIGVGYRAIADLRGEPLEVFTKKVALNFERYFEI